MYAFLSQPPPSKKTTRRVPPPPLSPSGANSNAISAWASRVYPGSPATCSPSSCASSPRSPAKRTSVGRRPSLTLSHRRGSSIGQRTPSTAEHRPDLTAFGYNSLFVQFDKTPTTPSPFRQRNIDGPKVVTPLTSDVFGSIPIPPVHQGESASAKKSGPLRRFRSFSILRSKKSKYNEMPPSPPTKSRGSVTKKPPAAKQKNKKKTTAPPTLANDIALMQFIGGGTVEDNVTKVMQARSKSASGRKAVEDVYRDGKGGIWYDKDEEMEYVHLLSFEDDKAEWEEVSEEETSPISFGNGILVKASSPYTNAYCPLDVTFRLTPTSMSSSTTSRSGGRSRPLLSLPSRPRRTPRRASHSHLTNPPSFILDLNLDTIDAFLSRTPRTTKSPRHPSVSPQSPGIRMKHRPRPAPLNLTSAQSAHARANAKVLQNQQWKKDPTVVSSVAGEIGSEGLTPQALEEARREFVEDSFRPVLTQGGGKDTF